MSAIEVNNLVMQYKNGVRALDGLTFNVNKGDIFCLLGPNGAGKSSLINILTTYYKPTSGSVTMLEKNLYNAPKWIRKNIACVAQQVSIDEHLSLMENMIFQSKIYKVNKQEAKQRIDTLIDKFGLKDYLKYPTSSYSGGVKRRLDLAMNMVSSPQILFLDEPTVGMDASSRKNMWEILFKIKKEYNTTIFLTTHYLEEADKLSDTICIIKDGKEVIQGKPEKIRNYIKQNMLKITFDNDSQACKYSDVLRKIDFVQFTKTRGSEVYIGVNNSKSSLPILSKWLVENDISFNAIEISNPSLEDVFLALTSPNHEETENNLC